MKKLDWAVLLPLAGCAALVLGIWLGWTAPTLAVIALAVLFVLFLLARSRAARLEELRLRCEELETLLEQTREDHQRQLSEMQAEVEKSHAEFFSQISHSLRMPLSVIQGYADLMQKSPPGSVPESEYLERIVLHTHRMMDILSKKLDPSQEDSAAISIKDQVDLVQIAQRYLDDLKHTAASHGVALQMISSETSLPVCADSLLLQRVFYNLIENSLNYMGREGIITVLLTRVDDMAHVTVRDDGLGLPENEIPQIFDAHFRGSNSMLSKGSGYGLFLVKQTVEAQGGTIRATSQPGRGMSVTFTLPLADEHIPAEV